MKSSLLKKGGTHGVVFVVGDKFAVPEVGPLDWFIEEDRELPVTGFLPDRNLGPNLHHLPL